ncbi:MAG: hypothetical protein VXW04_04430, partial [Bacteroidota bacterium]|nr:hypothetical protein [Bacteroidota bacterium]
MKKLNCAYLFAFVFFALTIQGISQEKQTQFSKKPDTFKATQIENLQYRYMPSFKDQIENGTFIAANPNDYKKEGPKKKILANAKVVPGKGLPKGNDPLVDFNSTKTKKQTREPLLTFQTTSNTATPGDPTGEIGKDYYFASWNSAFRIFNLDGTPAMDAASLQTLFSEDIGDPIVLYDGEIDRYVISSMGNSALNFAISETNDPINGGWHTYQASDETFPAGDTSFPDYPKYS